MENNYGTDITLPEKNADCFIRIPRSSISSKSIFRVGGRESNNHIYIVPMPEHSYLRLAGVKAEISCFKCKNIASLTSITSECKSCDGSGNFGKRCKSCKGSGIFESYKQCWECDGSGKVTEKIEVVCQHCDEGQIEQDCDECAGWDVDYGCLNCDGQGTVTVNCFVCHGKSQMKKWIETDCQRCNATGNFAWDEEREDCNDCEGSGTFHVKCRQCKGNGNIVTKCDQCKGKGVFLFS